MVLRRLLVQTRRLLHDRKWSNSLSMGLLDYCTIAQFLHKPFQRGNASHALTCVQSKLAARYLYAYSIEPECKNTKKLRLKIPIST